MIKISKKMKKRKLLFLCAISLVLLLSACGNKAEEVNYSIPDYSDVSVELYKSDSTIHSSDAKFMNDYIIAGIDGSLTIMKLDRSIAASFPEVSVNWIDSLEEEGLIIYGNSSNQVGIAKVMEADSSYNLEANNIIYQCDNLCIDPTIIKVKDYYYITFTEIIGTVNNSTPFSEDDAPDINGEYKLHMWRAKKDSDLGHSDSWEDIAVIQDNYHNTEDIDILYNDDHFSVLFEYEDYDKGCSCLKVIESKDSEGREWNEPKELLTNDADHEMASIWNEGDYYTLWYSSDKKSVGDSYMAGHIYYANYDKEWNLISKDHEINIDYSLIGGVRLYEVNMIDDKITFLYSRNYLAENELTVLRQSDY